MRRQCACLLVGLHLAALSLAAPQEDEKLACGPPKEKHEDTIHKGQHPSPPPSAGKAMIYVVQPRNKIGRGKQMKLAINGRWAAVVKSMTYTYLEVEPGLQKLCYQGIGLASRSHKFGFLTALPDKTHYILVHPDPITTSGKQIPAELTEEEGKQLVQKFDYITFEVKR